MAADAGTELLGGLRKMLEVTEGGHWGAEVTLYT